MGRSVMTYREAIHTAFVHLVTVDDEENGPDDYDMFLEDVVNVVQERYPTMKCVLRARRWEGREGRVVCENNHARVVVSEYCGVASISLIPNLSNYGCCEDNVAKAWCHRVKFTQHINKRFTNSMTKMGTFSNGEAVFTSNAVLPTF